MSRCKFLERTEKEKRKRTNPRAKSSTTVVATQVAPPSTRAETAGEVEEAGS